MADSSRVKLGNNPAGVLGVADKMKVRHESDGPASPLLTLTDVNWKEFVDNVPHAIRLIARSRSCA
jgi:hypothetical protein